MSGELFLYFGMWLILVSLIVNAIEHLTHGVRHMADMEAGALADLAAAVDAAVALMVKQAADLKAMGSPVDHSADIAALKQKLADAVAGASAPAA